MGRLADEVSADSLRDLLLKALTYTREDLLPLPARLNLRRLKPGRYVVRLRGRARTGKRVRIRRTVRVRAHPRLR